MRSVLARVFGGIALLLLTVIGIGLLLPGEWSVEARAVVSVPPDSVYGELSRVRSWPQWMPWPESGAEFDGPASGPGASFRWDDEVYGSGSFTIQDAVPGEHVTYRVSVEEDAVVVQGRMELRPVDGGTEIRWTEEGDAGWNPLVAFAALTQGDRQESQLQDTLDRLASHLEQVSGAAESEAARDDPDP
ncbi:MAG: SRPBCC family protein [Longimicrobiales bacterium]|nr:SRPBCC family protein [Longimicrobiales bacterium]